MDGYEYQMQDMIQTWALDYNLGSKVYAFHIETEAVEVEVLWQSPTRGERQFAQRQKSKAKGKGKYGGK